MGTRRQSDVWMYFDHRLLDKGSGQCVCRFPVQENETCGAQITTTNGATSPMKHHLDKNHPGWLDNARAILEEEQGSNMRYGTKRKRSEMRSTEEYQNLLNRAILQHGISFNILSCPLWRELLQNPVPVVPSPQKARKQVQTQAQDFRNSLRDELRQQDYISLTADMWSSKDEQKEMAVLASYVDNDMTLQTRFLGVEVVHSENDADSVLRAMKRIVSHYDVDPHKQVMAVVTDSASSMLCAVHRWQGFDQNQTRIGGSLSHCARLASLPCMAHILHNSINEAMNVPEISERINGVRKLVAKFRHSLNLTMDLKQVQSDRGKCLEPFKKDMKVRWQSTYKMLKRFLKIRNEVATVINTTKHMTEAAKKEAEDIVDNRYVCQIRELLPVLRNFFNVSCEIEREDKPTFSRILLAYASVFSSSLTQTSTDSSAVSKFKETIKNGFIHRMEKHDTGGTLLALYFDPTFKAKGALHAAAKSSNLIKWLKDVSDGKVKVKEFLRLLISIAPPERLPVDIRLSSSDSDESDIFGDSEAVDPIARYIDIEISRYKKIPVKPDDTALSFWKREGFQLPLMSEAARIFLAIPASPTGLERVFSTASWIRNVRRTKMKLSTLNDYLCIGYHQTKASHMAQDSKTRWWSTSDDMSDSDSSDSTINPTDEENEWQSEASQPTEGS